MINEERLIYHLKSYTNSLQNVLFKLLGKFFHDKNGQPVQAVYQCPLCLKEQIGIIEDHIYFGNEFSLDHYPPKSVGGKQTVLVCTNCNSTAGEKFDYTLKLWLQEQAFSKWTPSSKLRVKVQFENIPGNYSAQLTVKAPYSLKWNFGDYPKVEEWFKNLQNGAALSKTITFSKPKKEEVNKAILKAAYLHCFAAWGYDFIYSYTGHKIRRILFNEDSHPLSNHGVFFHYKNTVPEDGLYYVYKPSELQAFVVSMRIVDKDTGFQCTVTVLIPGPEEVCWENLNEYQKIIDTKEKFTQAMIQLSNEPLSPRNNFPYRSLWENRATFRIEGEENA